MVGRGEGIYENIEKKLKSALKGHMEKKDILYILRK